MANNDHLITFASIKERILDIEENVEPPKYCIYRVPNHLRKMNEEAYTPQVISIGPLHHGREELRAMEKEKLRFVRELGIDNRIKEETWQKFIDFIAEKEEEIRNCYAEMPRFGNEEFIAMIFYDAVFIVEYLLRYLQIHTGFSMSNLRRVSVSIWTDLLLLENQLPYFVLEKLYELAFSEPEPGHQEPVDPFFQHASRFVCDDMPYEENCVLSDVEVCHFTDLRRYAMIRSLPVASETELWIYGDRELPCAVKLQESGVKFKLFAAPKSLLDIRVQNPPRIPCLSSPDPELRIPNIKIYDETECLFRNLMALEQCHYPDATHICNYIDIMNNLIDSESDVNLLVKAGIISNFVGDTATIARLFDQLSAHIQLSGSSYYADIVKYLEEYYMNRWTQAKVPLKRALMRNWRCTGTVAAVLLLILTLIQTICSIKSVM